MNFFRNPSFIPRLSIYTFGHFYFEFVANYFLVAVIGPQLSSNAQMVTVLLIYNTCDYGLQLMIGLIDDIVHRNHYFAAAGAALFVVGYFLNATPLLMAAVIGVGAAFLHVPLGRQVLQDRPKVYAPLALFVAAGALGVFIGRQVALAQIAVWWPLVGISALMALVLVMFGSAEKQWNAGTEQVTSSRVLTLNRTAVSAILLLVIAVVVQAFAEGIMVFTWQVSGTAWVAAIAIFAGKALGGVFADKIGYGRSVLASMLAATIFAPFALSHPIAGIITLFAFNVTGATIIFRLASRFPPAPGTGFGTYKLFHIVGFYPVLFFSAGYFQSAWMLLVLMPVIGVLLYVESRISQPVDQVR